MPPKKPLDVVEGRGSILSYFSSSPAVRSSQGTATPATSSPAPARPRRRRRGGGVALTAHSSAPQPLAGPSPPVARSTSDKSLRATESLSAILPGPPSTRHRTTRSTSAVAASASLTAPQAATPAPSPAAARASMQAGPSSARTLRPRAPTDDADRTSVHIKSESASPSKANARYPLRSASATPVPADNDDGKGKGKAKAVVTLEIPDSSSEGEGGPRAFAQKVLACSSPNKPRNRSAATLTTLKKRTRKKYRWAKGADGRDELDLTISSSPSVASTLGNSDSDAESEIVVVTSKKRRTAPAPASATATDPRAGSLTPRASTSAAAAKPKSVGSPRVLVKQELLSSVGDARSPAARRPSASPRKLSSARGADAARMPPPPSPARAGGSAPASRPATPSRRVGAAVGASGGRSGSGKASGTTGDGTTPSRPAPVVELPGSASSKRMRSLSASSSRASVVGGATPRVAVTAASPTDAAPGRSSRGEDGVRPGAARPPLASSSSLASVGTASGAVTSTALSPRRTPSASVAASPSTPRRAAASSRASESASASPHKLTASALRAVPPRTPQHQHPHRRERSGPALIRSPSGSPLSSLGPTPQKLRAAPRPGPTPAAAAPSTVGPTGQSKKRWREHAFELVLDPPRRSASRAGSLAASASATKVSPPKKEATPRAREGKMRREREGATSEWDAFMEVEGEGGSGEEEEDEDEREASPSPAKKGTGRAAPTPDEEADSSGSSSDSDADSGASDSDADDFAALLAAAKAKREAGGGDDGAATGETSPHTAKTTVSPPDALTAAAAHHDDDEPRRSSRARRATEHFSPTKGKNALASSRPAPMVRKPAGLGLLGAGGRSDVTFEKIMRERDAKEKRGRGQDWLEGWQKVLEDSDDDEEGDEGDEDVDARSDASDGSLRPLDTSLVTSALRGADVDDDDDLPAPPTKAASKQARAVERVLAEEKEAERQRLAGGETREERQARRVWPVEETNVNAVDTSAWEGKGWRGAVAQALKDGLDDPNSFPSPLSLFSALSPTGRGTAEDQRVVAGWLTATIMHPSTPAAFADRLVALLHRIAMLTARSLAGPASALVEAARLGEHLMSLGAWTPSNAGRKASAKSHEADDNGDAAMGDGDSASILVGRVERQEAVTRWCRIVQALSGTSPRLFGDGDVLVLAKALLGLSLDPTAATSRSTLDWTLRGLLASVPDASPIRVDMFGEIVETYGANRPGLQLAVLQALPHDSEANKGMRRWIAWAFLAGVARADVKVPPAGFTSSILPNLLVFLASPPHQSPFHRLSSNGESGASTARDIALADCTRILFTALTSLDSPLLASPSRVEERKTLESIIAHLEALDSRLRADARKGLAVERLAAKNLLTMLSHSATHQLRGARGQTHGAFDFSEEEERTLARGFDGKGDAAGGREAKRPKVDIGAADLAGFKQTTLAFRKPAAATRTSGATRGSTMAVEGQEGNSPSSDQEVEEELLPL